MIVTFENRPPITDTLRKVVKILFDEKILNDLLTMLIFENISSTIFSK